MKFLLIILICTLLFADTVKAGKITGLVTDNKGVVLPYASILVKGTATGTTTNDAGRYVLELRPGRYILVCQYVGYERAEKPVTVTAKDEAVDFRLVLQQTSMKEVVITANGEDPAYAIIRNAMAKRKDYLNQVKEFQCKVYIKGQLKLRAFPKKLFGQPVDFEDGDSSKLRMLYLAETVSTYSVQQPGKVKIEVTSSKVSGQSDGFGLSQPQIFSFYENNLQIGTNLNPRGFISPIASNALEYYTYKYEGSFTEEGKEINKIKVIPKKKYEPVFSGYINITENDWRIHSLRLQLNGRESQMDLIDTLRIEQLYVPLNKEVWMVKNQVMYPAASFFGFDGYGSFVNVYSDFNLHPAFGKKFFGNTYLKYTDSSNKRTRAYWDSVRPVPLEVEEIKDYKKKDSLEQVRKSPRYLDSLDKVRNKLTMTGVVITGQSISRQRKKASISFIPLIDALNFNTAEGLVLNVQGTYTRHLDSSRTRRSTVFLTPNIRYGFSNHHVNAGLLAGYRFGTKYFSTVTISGGKGVYQFNNASPIRPRDNTLSTLFLEKNYMKTYEAWYGVLNIVKGVGEGVTLTASTEYQDRLPLNNTTHYTFIDHESREFTPNYPFELLTGNIRRHQALSATAGISWQPGARYIEFPDSKINIGSKYPRFDASYTKGFEGVLGSDADYDKWRFTVSDNLNLALAGSFSYRVSVGGFLNRRLVQAPDFQHFNGNQSVFAGAYLNSFQLAPYYQNSTTATSYATVNVEHHFNGLLTNKIPVFQKLNWNLVMGTNAFFVNPDNDYLEVFAAIENIFRFFRVDFIQSFSAGRRPYSGIVLGLQGALFRR